MIKDNTLYVYYELDLKSEKISYIQCALSYGGLPVISDDLKERVAYIPNNKANEISLRIPLKEALLLSSKTGKITFVRRLPIKVEESLSFTNDPDVDEVRNITTILREASRALMEELRINYEMVRGRISVDKKNNNPLAILSIKKTIKSVKSKKTNKRLEKLLFRMLYREYIKIVNGLNVIGPMFNEEQKLTLSQKK